MSSGYGKTVSHVVIGLKTAKGTKQLKLDPSIYDNIQKEKVDVGDVIYIEANSGAVRVRQRADFSMFFASLFFMARKNYRIENRIPPSYVIGDGKKELQGSLDLVLG